MRYRLFTVLLVFIVGMAFRSPGQTGGGSVNGVVAIVDDYIITLHELRVEMARLGVANDLEMMQQVLKALIEEKLILSDFEDAGYAIPDGYFNDLFDESIQRRYGDDRLLFVESLKNTGQHLEDARREFKEDQIIQFMSDQKIRRQIAISPNKIERYYLAHQDEFREKDRVNLRMIIIPANGSEDAAAVKKGEMILQKIRDGEEFAELAREYSSSVQAREGGLMGWQGREAMRAEIAEVAFDMEEGETSGLIRTPAAFFIVRLEEKKDAHVRPLADVREDIERTLRSEETARRRDKWMAELREKSFVRTF